jgi:hypothetical protein
MNESTAVCDIDACFTNRIELPTIPKEQMYVRILNVTRLFLMLLDT